jgi:hypothetical protein
MVMKSCFWLLGALLLLTVMSGAQTTNPLPSAGSKVSDVQCTGQSTWCIRRETSGRICHLQLTTAAPIGTDYLGPFDKKSDAIDAMCAAYDSTLTDPSKCWATLPPGTCPDSKLKKSP